MKAKKIITGIIQGLLAVAMLMAGGMKLSTPYEVLSEQMLWVQSVSPGMVKTIGALEVLGAIGLFLPYLIKKYRQLIPLAAIGLALTMLGAIITHAMLNENIVAPLVLMIMAGYVAYSRKAFFKAESLNTI